jgi:hypothetical protein
MAMYNLINGILNVLNNRNMVGRIFCNLGKAFDCVNRGMVGHTQSLIKSYLENRHQRVILKDSFPQT